MRRFIFLALLGLAAVVAGCGGSSGGTSSSGPDSADSTPRGTIEALTKALAAAQTEQSGLDANSPSGKAICAQLANPDRPEAYPAVSQNGPVPCPQTAHSDSFSDPFDWTRATITSVQEDSGGATVAVSVQNKNYPTEHPSFVFNLVQQNGRWKVTTPMPFSPLE